MSAISEGLHTRQSLMLDLQLHPPRRINFNEVDELPRDNARRELPGEPVNLVGWQCTLQQPAQSTTQPNLDLRHLETGLGALWRLVSPASVRSTSFTRTTFRPCTSTIWRSTMS